MNPRQKRVQVLEALERRVKQFRSREELWPLRVPHAPVPLDDVLEEALGDERRGFDVLGLRARTVLHLEWEDGSRWAAWVIVLPSLVKVYCDSGDDESRVLASGGRNEGDETDRLFLERLSESAGADFGIEMAGGPPARVRSSIADRRFLVDAFVTLFEVTGMEQAVRDAMRERGAAPAADASVLGHDFRADVEEWFNVVRG